MTPKIIELKQAPVVLVELPTSPSNNEEISIERTNSGIVYRISYPTSFDMCRNVSFPMDFPDYVKMIGILSDLTEEQFEDLEFLKMPHDVDYEGDWFMHFPLNEDYVEIYAAGAFYSLLESENVYTENPFGEKAPVNNEFYWGYLNDFEQWQEAQSRTIDPKRTVVLIRKED